MDFILHIIIRASFVLFVVAGYNVVFGKGKILHFGQEAQDIVVAYMIWVLVMRFGFPLGVALLAGVLAAVLSAALFTWLSLRLEPDGFGVMSIAVHLACLSVVLNWQSVTRGALGIPRIPRAPFPSSLEGFALLTSMLLVAWLLVLWRLDRGTFGRQLTALAGHEWHAASLGIDRRKVHFLAFLISGIGVVFAATLFPSYIFLLTPSDYHFPAMILFVMCTVAGGPGHLWGVSIATFAIVFLREGLRFISLPPDILGPMQLILFGLILLVAVWYRRDTLFPKQRVV